MNGHLVASVLCRRGVNSYLNLARVNQGLSGLNSLKSAKWLTSSSAIQSSTKLNPSEGFWDKNKRLSRPLSPHLGIYKWQITMVLSIAHRGTGLALSGMTSMFAIGMLMASSPYPTYIELLQTSHLGAAILFSAKFLLTFPLAFHFLNGIRHLAWDMGKGFEIKTLNTTGIAVVIGSVVSSILAAAI